MIRTEGQRLLLEKAERATHAEIARRIRRSRPTVTLLLSGARLPDVVSAARMQLEYGIPAISWAQKPNGKKKRRS